MPDTAPMTGWSGSFPVGGRPSGVHPLASVGGPPEHRSWMVGDPMLEPEIHPTALVNAFCTIDAGMPYKPTTRIGARSFLQVRVHLGHNAIVGDDCELCGGVTICGEVTIGNGVRIGGNSWVKPLVTIGDGAIIGGGSVVTKDVPPHEVWCGNPARFLKLAWTHPDYGKEQQAPEAAWDHPLRDSEEVWAYMAPWHTRDLEGRNKRIVDEFRQQGRDAARKGDRELFTTLLNKHDAVKGRLGRQT